MPTSPADDDDDDDHDVDDDDEHQHESTTAATMATLQAWTNISRIRHFIV